MLEAKSSARSSNKRLFFFIFTFFFLINLASSGGHLDPFDGVQSFLVTESMVLKHSAKLYPDVPSITKLHWDVHVTNPRIDPHTKKIIPEYQDKPLLISAMAIPFYYAAQIFSVSPIAVVGLFVNSIIISLTSLVIFCFSLEIYRSKKISFVLSLIFSVCSFVWPMVSTFEAQPLMMLCIIAATYFIYLSTKASTYSTNSKTICFAALGGILLGLSIFAYPVSIVLIPGFIVYVIFVNRRDKKLIGSFLVPLVIFIIFAGLVNYWRYGSFTEFGYYSYAAHNGWTGLIGLLISPGAGLIFYFPMAVLLPLALKYMYNRDRWQFLLFTYVVVATWLQAGTLSNQEPYSWSGWVSWGPRYLIPILPFITIASGTLFFYFENKPLLKTLVIILCVAGFYVNLHGVLIWYMYGYSYAISKGGLMKYEIPLPQGFTQSASQTIATWLMTYVPYYSPIALHIGALLSNYPSHIKVTPDYWSYGNAPCSYDNYLFCKSGIRVVALFFVIIAILGMLIMAEISVDPRSPIKKFLRKTYV